MFRATSRGAARRGGSCSSGRRTTSCRWRTTRRRSTGRWRHWERSWPRLERTRERSMVRHTLAVRSLWCLAAVVQLQASPIVMDDELPPLVVPVARGLAPYGLEVVWRAFTTGDTTPSAYRAKYTGRACENTQFFLRREFGGWQPCRALVLAPWLEMVGSMPDAILARRVVLFADSTANLASVADSTGRVNAVVAAVAGDRGATRLIAVNYSAR